MMRNAANVAASAGMGDLDNHQPATPTAALPTHSPTPLEVFELRVWAKAYLVQCGRLDFLDAIDELQAGAEWSGLVEELGQDRVQAVLAKEFGAIQ